ncbi:hypothetical protein PN499_13975 [Kamptonema animale CS-326]|jgi:hypothetical protein|nr:hypothetical protein [Kamptonema animale]MDB9512295.1 hypothetical protein [Kamptonema animale CS-326]
MRILLVGDEQRIAPALAEAVTDNIAFDLLELAARFRALLHR